MQISDMFCIYFAVITTITSIIGYTPGFLGMAILVGIPFVAYACVLMLVLVLIKVLII